MSGNPIRMSMAAVQLVQKKPRTAKELGGLLGVSLQQSRRYLGAMEEEGLVSRHRPESDGEWGSLPSVYTWSKEAA